MRIVGSPPFTGSLCGDFSPHRTTMTQTKCCPIFAFWVVVVCLSNGSSRSHRALEGSSLPSCFFPFVFLLRRSTLALRLRVSGSWQRSEFYVFLRRYGRRSGQPSSSSLARRACVHYSGWLAVYCATPSVFVPFKFVYWLFLKFASAPWPLRRPRGDGNGGRFVRSPCLTSWRGLRHYALHQMLSFCSLVQQQSIELPATTVGECRRRQSL